MSRTLVSVSISVRFVQAIVEGNGLLSGRCLQKWNSRGMAENCDDHTCGKDQNYWKGKLEMTDYNYLQPKRPQFDPNKSTDVKEKPEIPRVLDIYKERNCRIIQDCKKAASGGGDRPKCPKDTPENVDDSLLAAQCFVLFVAGVETTSFTLSYCLYELAHHREVQEELYDEISQVLKTNGGNLPYDELNNLKLLDMVISETLRKYPPLPDVNRICKTDYRIPDTNIVIPKGCRVQVPLYSLHRDPNVYPDPEKFDPKRFSPERKNSIPKGSFLPFGDGPRNCIGKRFALSEMKVCLSKFINAYKVDVTPGLCYPMEYDANSRFLLVAKKPIELKVLKRETI